MSWGGNGFMATRGLHTRSDGRSSCIACIRLDWRAGRRIRGALPDCDVKRDEGCGNSDFVLFEDSVKALSREKTPHGSLAESCMYTPRGYNDRRSRFKDKVGSRCSNLLLAVKHAHSVQVASSEFHRHPSRLQFTGFRLEHGASGEP